MLTIYVLHIKELKDKENRERLQAFLPLSRRNKAFALKNEEDQLRCYGAGLLLAYGLAVRHIDYSKVSIETGERGKEFLPGFPSLHYNLSHAKDYVVCAFSDYEIGIDIEPIPYQKSVEQLSRIIARVGSDMEIARYQEAYDPEVFAHIWTQKESYVKALGTGIRDILGNTSIEREHSIASRVWDKDYIMSVCILGKEKIKPDWNIELVTFEQFINKMSEVCADA